MADESWFFKSLTKEEMDFVLNRNQIIINEESFLNHYEVWAALQLGVWYMNSKNNPQKAAKFFQNCIKLYHENKNSIDAEIIAETKKNYYFAVYDLADCYKNGKGVPQDYKKAAELFHIAADEYNDADAQNALGIMYQQGLGVKQNDNLSGVYFEMSANQGNMFAQNTLGRYYEFGGGVGEKNLEKAVYWYKRAAEQGDDLAAENLMRLQGADIPVMGSYEIPGTNIKVDDVFKKTVEAAEKGDLLAQETLAEFYIIGDYIPKDVEKGLELMEQYADAGNPYSQYNLGVIYHQGLHNLPQNKNKAFYYYKLAARQGFTSAKFNLANFYWAGFVVEQNLRKAFQWMESAAEDGHPQAQFEMFIYYSFGIGCDKNRSSAVIYLKRAALKGNYAAQGTVLENYNMGNFKDLPPYVIDSDFIRQIKKEFAENHEGNRGYNVSIGTIGSIPHINDYDAEDKNFKMPPEILENREYFERGLGSFKLSSNATPQINNRYEPALRQNYVPTLAEIEMALSTGQLTISDVADMIRRGEIQYPIYKSKSYSPSFQNFPNRQKGSKPKKKKKSKRR